MPTTRRQAAIAEGRLSPDAKPKAAHEKPPSKQHNKRPLSRTEQRKENKVEGKPPSTRNTKQPSSKTEQPKSKEAGDKASHNRDDSVKQEEPPTKKLKTNHKKPGDSDGVYKPGTIERGHIYFFYRPRVQLEEAHSIDDIKNFHILLVPRPPEFAASSDAARNNGSKPDPDKVEESEMKVLSQGADAVPAGGDGHEKKFYRLITVGKKKLPDPEGSGSGSGRRKEMFWATVTAVGDDLDSLEAGLGAKSYETKTRGTRHEEPARLVGRGGYAIVNSDAEVPSKRETHLGYHISHPSPADIGDVQNELGIYSASSFVMQIKNPLAPSTGVQMRSKPAEYPDWIMQGVFGASQNGEKSSKGRESYGLRFASCETPELLDYLNTQILLIAARDGEEGLEKSLGDGRGTALSELEEKEGHEPLRKAFDELGLDLDRFPVQSLQGSWI